jgi:hypothetical protein
MLRDTPEAGALEQQLRDQPAWTPPPLPAPDGGADAAP